MKTYGEKATRQSRDFKAVLHETIIEQEEKVKQDSLAYYMNIQQSVISEYLNPDSQRNLPAFQLKNLPKEIRIPLINYLVEDLNIRTVNMVHVGKLNGQIDDEILLMAILEGELAKMKDEKPEKLQKILDKMEEVIHKLRMELLLKKQ
ncbi:MAG: hypothetical protein H3C35_03540 [Bacteroidetes bacterium]|nr:hypothetical protein [Bacteroidota bacterium]